MCKGFDQGIFGMYTFAAKIKKISLFELLLLTLTTVRMSFTSWYCELLLGCIFFLWISKQWRENGLYLLAASLTTLKTLWKKYHICIQTLEWLTVLYTNYTYIFCWKTTCVSPIVCIAGKSKYEIHVIIFKNEHWVWDQEYLKFLMYYLQRNIFLLLHYHGYHF